MAIFTQENNKCYFVHIPRTGGRYISSLFEKSNVKCEYHLVGMNYINGIDAANLHWPLYVNSFDVINIPHICVVRNPFKKFESAIRIINSFCGIDLNDMDESTFYDYIHFQMSTNSSHNNWFLPQHKFISDKTLIWKYEWGLGKRFVNWIYKKTNIKIINQKVSYEKLTCEHRKNTYQLNRKIKKFVKKFYIEDYKKFKYFL